MAVESALRTYDHYYELVITILCGHCNVLMIVIVAMLERLW